jgi:hypothetical protein
MKDKKKHLNEELKRFNMLNEYSFYVPEGDDPAGDIDDLLLSEEDPEADADLEGLEADLDAEGGDVADPEMEDEPMDDMGGEEPMEEPAMDEPDMGGEELSVDEPEDEVELDVTELVASADEAKASADSANAKVDQLMGMVGKLESQLNDVNSIGAKIDNLENELEKRAPTPEEKIEMRSLDSYPYNLKLTDFWKTQEGKYDVLSNDEEEGTPKEYTLTKDDIDSDYSEAQIKSSLDDTMSGYEEEDVDF